ncbi:tigger transposable element-derived protein 4-like [Dermacentor andersoni]|uniref:tigger transposable element-derived protein 4-like n=1 Tax=Dermacentor andersoni TaxID=34620 RepID=UPI003B3A9F35
MAIQDFKFTDGWIHGFKNRHGVSFKKVCGESSAVGQSTVTDYRTSKLKALPQAYAPADIFNCDKTGLFFNMLPDRSLCFTNEACAGGKHSKETVTVMVGANAVGTEKLPLLVIGKAKNPHCFKGAKYLPVWYSGNTKAWITQSLFEDYNHHVDRMFECQKRQVVIVVDNCMAHGAVNNLQAICLEFLPPNTTSVLQPMDQGVIKNLKVHYRARLLGRTLMCFDNGKTHSVNLFTALGMLADAWKAVQPSMIANCYRHAGFCNSEEPMTEEANGTDDDINTSEQLIDNLRSSGMDLPAAVTFHWFAAIDNNIELCPELTDDEIVRQVTALPQSDSDSDTSGCPQPSTQDVIALILLSSEYDENVTLKQMQAEVVTKIRSLKQGTISDFFSPV